MVSGTVPVHIHQKEIDAIEVKIGRLLTKSEIAHHINGNKKDNNPNNLELMTISEHNKLTALNRKKDKYGKFK